MTHRLEYWVEPQTSAARIGDMATDIMHSHGFRFSRETAQQMAAERMDFLESVVGHLMESGQAEGEQSVQLELPIL